MNKRVVAGFALPVLLFASVGQAADLPRGYAPAYAPRLAPIFTWTGFYGGVVGGYGLGDLSGSGRALRGKGSPDGGLIGGTLGYNYQLPNNFVVGLEGDAVYAGIDDTTVSGGPLTVKHTLDFEMTLRARAGFAVNRMLFYATGGYAGGNLHSAVYDVPSSFYGADSVYLNGFALGGGAEYAIMPNLSGKVEYLYTDLGKDLTLTGTRDVSRVGITTSNLRAGLNYHF